MAVLLSLHATQYKTQWNVSICCHIWTPFKMHDQFCKTCCVQMNLSDKFVVDIEISETDLKWDLHTFLCSRKCGSFFVFRSSSNYSKKGEKALHPCVCRERLLLYKLVKLTHMVYYSIMVPLSCSGPFWLSPQGHITCEQICQRILRSGLLSVCLHHTVSAVYI